MNKAPARAGSGTEPRIERLQTWIAALASAVLHLLFLLIALLVPPIDMTPPQDSAAGGSQVTEVNFIDEALPQAVSGPPMPNRPAAAPTTSPIRTTPVARADDPLPPDAVAPSPDNAPRPPSPRPAASPPTQPQRQARVWGQPPGMRQDNPVPVNAGPARSLSSEPGHRPNASTSGPSLETGGYQVYYDLRSETRLREWSEQGMTELFMPLPGTRQYMVCPLETALRRESGPCRLLDPNDPELDNIGDARKVINMHQVYRRGELVWSGPRPYR